MTYKKKDYYTTLSKAKDLVPGFKEAFSRFEERLVLDQCSKVCLPITVEIWLICPCILVEYRMKLV
jgi:hypothetical protein